MRPRFSIVCWVLTPHAVHSRALVFQRCEISGALYVRQNKKIQSTICFFFCFFFHNKQKGNNIYTQSFHAVAEGKLNVELRIKKKNKNTRSTFPQEVGVCVLYFSNLFFFFNILVLFCFFSRISIEKSIATIFRGKNLPPETFDYSSRLHVQQTGL